MSASATATAATVAQTRSRGGRQRDGQQRQQRAEREGEHRRPGGVPGVGEVVGVDAELGLGVGGQGVVGGQLLGHLQRQAPR